MRALVAAMVVAACGPTTSRDEIVGTWRGGSRLVHLRADGSYDAPVTSAMGCEDERALIDACGKRQHWDRRGDEVRFWPAFVASNSSRNGSFLGMFNAPAKRDAPPCECRVQDEPEVFQLRDAMTLVHGKESATRVVLPAWPLPDGWREEELAFPLEFAPTIAQHGIELLRFAPGFLDPKSPGYWSYAFAWWPDPGERGYDAATIAPVLATYFDGLVASVNASSHKIIGTPPPARVELADGRGTIAIVDPFATGAPVTLHARVRFVDCDRRRAVIVDLSPTAERADLAALAARFACGR